MSRPRSFQRLAGVAAWLVVLATFAGCGGAPPPETVSRPLTAGPAPDAAPAATEDSASVEPELPFTGPVESRRSPGSEAAMRTYLADRYIYEAWYPSIGEIEVVLGTASVLTSLPARGSAPRETAESICAAVLRSRRINRVLVMANGRISVECP